MKRFAGLLLFLMLTAASMHEAAAQFQVPSGCVPVGRGPTVGSFLSGCANAGQLRQLNLSGSSSGVISLKGQAAAGTYNFNLPTTSGVSGQALVSGGGGATAMGWASVPTLPISSANLGITPTNCSTGLSLTALDLNALGTCTTVAAAAGTLTGSTLAAGVTASSLTSVGTIATGTWNGTTIAVAKGGTGLTAGTSGGVLAYTATGTLASSGALTANLPVIGGGAGAVPTVGSRSGNTTTFATTTGAFTTGHCLQIDGNGNVTDAGGACTTGGGGGTVSSGTAGQLTYYASTGTVVAGNVNATIVAGALTLGQAGSVIGSTTYSGNTSGGVTVLPQAAAGTYNFNLPTSAGSSGQPLLSGGGGSTAQTYGTLGVAAGGTGLTAGTSGGILAYTATGTLASSGALTANLPVIGGGAGVAPTVGTRSGNTTAYVTTTGAQTSGNCVSIDANGNHIAAGTTCASPTVTVGSTAIASGTTTRVLFNNSSVLGEYAVSGTGSVCMTTSCVMATPNMGTPSAGVLTNATGLPLTTGVTGTLPVANGGLGITSGTSGGVLAFTASGTVASSTALGANAIVLGGGAGAAPSSIASLGLVGQALVSQGGSSPPVFTGGGWVLLNTLTASSSATLSDTTSFTNAYNEYELVFENLLPSINAVQIALQVQSGGSFQATSYVGGLVGVNSAGSGSNTATAAGNILLNRANNLSNAVANGGLSGRIVVFTPSGTAAPKSWLGHFDVGTGSGTSENNIVSARWNNTAAVTGFRTLPTSGVFTSGVVKVYGRL